MSEAIEEIDRRRRDGPSADPTVERIGVPWEFEPGQQSPRAWWRQVVELLPELGRLLRALMRDERVPRRAKLLAAGATAYVAAPVELLPDVVPGAGGFDDVLVLVWALRRLVATAGYDVVRELWTGSDDGFALLVVVTGMGR